MKSFDEYINEARQSYIFGGTDDRNVDLEDEPKKLSELKKYDNVYYFSTWTMKRPDIGTINDISSGKTNTCISLSLKSNSNIHIATVHNKSLDKDCFFRYLQDPGGDFEVICTNKDSFLRELSGHYRTIDTSLIDKVDEARLSYIFGGTDDRNTDIAPDIKPFAELEDGDIIYYASRNKIVSLVFRNLERGKNSKFWIITYTRGTNYNDLQKLTLDNPMIDVKKATTSYVTTGGAVGTNKDDIIKLANKTWFTHYTEDDIQDLTESNHNYIFGGTDDRNTVIKTTFKDLEQGDKFYVWRNNNYEKKYIFEYVFQEFEDDIDNSGTYVFGTNTFTVHDSFLLTNKELQFDVVIWDKDGNLVTDYGKKNDVSWVFTVDKDTMLKTLNKFGINLHEKDILK